MTIQILSRFNKTIPNGIAIINDPHLTATPPSSRQDDYPSIIQKKIEVSLDVCNQMNLIPLFPGDIFYRPVETSELIKNVLIDTFYTTKFSPIVIPGNHDMSGSKLSRKDSLYTILSSRCCVIGIESGPIAHCDILTNNGIKKLCIGGTPYGQEIPNEVIWDIDPDYSFWMTHHNLPFSTHYKEKTIYGFKEIIGVNHVVNGHLHHPAPSVKEGQTTYHNFGSVTRTKSDEADRIPLITLWTPDNGFETLALESETTDHAFKLGGRQTASQSAIKEAGESGKRFVDFLAQGDRTEVDIDKEFQVMYQNGQIDNTMVNYLIDLSSKAKKIVNQ